MKKPIAIGAAALAIVLLAFYLGLPGRVPPVQPPLVKLTSANVAQFEAVFDADLDMPRVVLLFSPT